MSKNDNQRFPLKKLIAAFSLFAVVSGFIVIGALFTGPTEPNVENFESFETDENGDDIFVEQSQDGTIHLNGYASISGDDAKITDISNTADETVVTIGSDGENSQEKSVAYETELSGVENNTLRVVHENGDEYIVNLDKLVSYEIEHLSSDAGEEEDADVTRDDDEIIVEGKIVANTGEQEPVIENINIENGELTVDITTEQTSDIATQVITSYEYQAVISDVPDTVQDVTVTHHEDVIVEENLTYESVNVETIESSAGDTDSSMVEVWNDNRIILEGNIVGNTGGQNVTIMDTVQSDETLTIILGTERDSSMATDVITTYTYTLTIQNTSYVSAVEIVHEDGESYVHEKPD